MQICFTTPWIVWQDNHHDHHHYSTRWKGYTLLPLISLTYCFISDFIQTRALFGFMLSNHYRHPLQCHDNRGDTILFCFLFHSIIAVLVLDVEGSRYQKSLMTSIIIQKGGVQAGNFSSLLHFFRFPRFCRYSERYFNNIATIMIPIPFQTCDETSFLILTYNLLMKMKMVFIVIFIYAGIWLPHYYHPSLCLKVIARLSAFIWLYCFLFTVYYSYPLPLLRLRDNENQGAAVVNRNKRQFSTTS